MDFLGLFYTTETELDGRMLGSEELFVHRDFFSAIVAKVGIAGSARPGNHVVLGGQCYEGLRDLEKFRRRCRLGQKRGDLKKRLPK